MIGDTPTFNVYVSDIGPAGPQGDVGPEGPPGTATFVGISTDFEYTATVDGIQSFTIPNTPLQTGYKLFINGLRQSKSSYTVTTDVVELPDSLNILTNDFIIFEYFY